SRKCMRRMMFKSPMWITPLPPPLTGDAGDMQLPGATMAGVFNMGGAAVTNYVSILERVR
ncbi:hypothetical protein, partial [Paracoccus marcusii]